jgi:hypothetical protein
MFSFVQLGFLLVNFYQVGRYVIFSFFIVFFQYFCYPLAFFKIVPDSLQLVSQLADSVVTGADSSLGLCNFTGEILQFSMFGLQTAFQYLVLLVHGSELLLQFVKPLTSLTNLIVAFLQASQNIFFSNFLILNFILQILNSFLILPDYFFVL